MDRKNFNTIFLSIAAAILFFFALYHIAEIWGFIYSFITALQPLWVGIVFAYLLCPVAAFFERKFAKIKPIARFARALSVLVTSLAVLAAFALLCTMLIPQLVTNVAELAVNFPTMLEKWIAQLQAYLATDSDLATALNAFIEPAKNMMTSWVKNNFLDTVYSLANSIMSIGSAVINVIVAFIITIYLLFDYERYISQCRKPFHAVSKNERINLSVHETIEQANKTFGGFITGKLIDSLIVGVICFIFMMILGMPYALLISVIIGVTNIIPMFGPFIGAIPSAFLLLLVSPQKCLIFIIFIIILQQIDGNVIGPRILGNSTGLSALYVTIAILIFGKLFGFLGMIIGVPLFATIYYMVKRLAEYSLKQRGLPTRTSAYRTKNEDLIFAEIREEIAEEEKSDTAES